MAILSKILVATTLLCGIATAAPLIPRGSTTEVTTSLASFSTTTSTQSAASATPVPLVARVSGSPSGTCEGEGAACEGDVTHWDGGLGACGTTVDTNADMAVSLPYAFMGTLSNSNPLCGRSVTLYNPNSGTKVQATVRDKCMGCVDRAIDTTDALFNAITDGTGNGRYPGIVWWLN